MSVVHFSRRPYPVTYYKDGQKVTIMRRPPEKVHDALPEDIVELKIKKNDDWNAGDDFKVKHINPRHPNILQIEKSDGETTFVPYFDVELEEMVAPRAGYQPKDIPKANKYLLWP